jgi:endonuclease YncB( thermonuclease family)
VELLSGNVIKITEPNAFMLRGSDRQPYSVALLGTVPPAIPAATPTKPRTEPESVRQAKERLSDLILSNEVSVEVTVMDAFRRGVGIVHLGETNVNAVMVESGLLELKRDYIKGLPLSDQYALIRAERRAKTRNLASTP